MKKEINKILISSMCIAISIIFASIVHLIGGISLGAILSPMHIPVFIGGMILGWRYGLAIGIIVPILSSIVRGIPPLMPTAVGMSLELGAYGAVSGVFAEKINISKHEILNLYLALIIGMLGGRLIYGVYYSFYYKITSAPWGLEIYITSIFIKPIIGIIFQLYSIPFVVYAIKKSGVLEKLE